MPDPFISVLVPTNRVGGLDILFDGLRNQTWKDFELVLVDAIQPRRKDLVRAEAERWDFPVIHVEPIGNSFPRCAFCRAANTALVYARGRTVLWLPDYVYLEPSALEIHAAFHVHQAKGPRNWGLMTPIRYAEPPKRRSTFPDYGFEELGTYLLDLEEGRLDDCLWSIFEKRTGGIPWSELPEDRNYGTDQRRLVLAGPIAPGYFNAKGESVPLDAALDVNGFDEALDGTNGWQDTMFSEALCVQLGFRWNVYPVIQAHVVNPRRIFPHPKWERDYMTNEPIWKAAKEEEYTKPINTWNLRMERAGKGR